MGSLKLTYNLTEDAFNEMPIFDFYPLEKQESASKNGVNYFPYGKVLRSYTNGNTTADRYPTTGHERDDETGFDYRGARFYDSEIGWFLSVDLCAAKYAAWSTYNYVMGNPIIFTDPTGKGPIQRDKDGNIVYATKNEMVEINHASGRTVVVEIGYVFADDGTPVQVFKNNSMDAGFDTNCHGTTFTDGKYWLNNDELPKLLNGENYNQAVTVSEAKVNDKVVYLEGDEHAHSMTVVKTNGTPAGMKVYGQGGVEVENHIDNAVGAWPSADGSKIVRKETPDKVVNQEQIQELIKTIPNN